MLSNDEHVQLISPSSGSSTVPWTNVTDHTSDPFVVGVKSTDLRPSNPRHSDLSENITSHSPLFTDYNEVRRPMLHQESIILERFNVWYQNIHGYLSFGVCVFGIISNTMNIVVLTRKNMITATNLILTALAVADMLTMLCYLPYALYFYCIASLDNQYPHSRGWIVYLLFNNNFNITCHTGAMWLTVLLAVFRYIVVCHHVFGPGLCTIRRARIAIASVLLTTVLFCVPNYVMHVTIETGNGTYWFQENDFVTPTYKSINYWSFGVFLKVAPCVFLTVLSVLLIRTMRGAADKRRRLNAVGKRAESERAGDECRTTAMLVAVVLCFVVTELPQGILAFLSGIDDRIFAYVYVPLGDIWDILVLVNSAVNFILYCAMNGRFRATFSSVFCSACIAVTPPDPNAVDGLVLRV